MRNLISGVLCDVGAHSGCADFATCASIQSGKSAKGFPLACHLVTKSINKKSCLRGYVAQKLVPVKPQVNMANCVGFSKRHFILGQTIVAWFKTCFTFVILIYFRMMMMMMMKQIFQTGASTTSR